MQDSEFKLAQEEDPSLRELQAITALREGQVVDGRTRW